MSSCNTPSPPPGPAQSPSGPGYPVPSDYPYAREPAFSAVSSPGSANPGPRGMPSHACMGLNSCKAADRFGVAGPAPADPNVTLPSNDCAGQGYCSTATQHTCHVQNSCKDQGGCGLYGTGEEMDRPGDNACRSQGSCATPINAERFSTNGPNQGKSVWLRAREVFEEKWPMMRAELLARQAAGEIDSNQPLPLSLGPPPEAFAGTGPSYLWISADNADRDNMTACGSSGMSGAGGCS